MAITNSRIAVLFSLVVATTSLNSAASQAETPVVDPAAVATLQKMTDYFSVLQQFSVHTQSTLEDVLDSGERIDYDVTAEVDVRRPDKLHSRRIGDEVSQAFYYDGKSLTLYTPADATYATRPAPKTIEELLDYTRESLGLLIPISDLVYRNAFAILMPGVSSAKIVGKTTIGDRVCTHLAFRRPDVDFQVWVAEGEQPLPCKYVVTDKSTPALISTVTVMSDWDFTPVSDATFTFALPDGAKAIEFIPYDDTKAFGR